MQAHLQACHSVEYMRGPGAATSPGWKQQGPSTPDSLWPHLTHTSTTSSPSCCCCCGCCRRFVGEGLLLGLLLLPLLRPPAAVRPCCHCCHCLRWHPVGDGGRQGALLLMLLLPPTGLFTPAALPPAALQTLLWLMSCRAGRQVAATLARSMAAASAAFTGATMLRWWGLLLLLLLLVVLEVGGGMLNAPVVVAPLLGGSLPRPNSLSSSDCVLAAVEPRSAGC